MKELVSLFDALYDRFLLRDVFAKIVPGSVLLVALYIALVRPDTPPADAVRLVTAARVSTWIVLGPTAWIVAFGIQWLGERVGFLRYYGTSIADDKTFYKKVICFADAASPREGDNYERFVVIKETCGNAAVSLVLSGAVLLFPWHDAGKLCVSLAVLAGGLVLAQMHKLQVERQTWWVEAVTEFRQAPEKGLPFKIAAGSPKPPVEGVQGAGPAV